MNGERSEHAVPRRFRQKLEKIAFWWLLLQRKPNSLFHSTIFFRMIFSEFVRIHVVRSHPLPRNYCWRPIVLCEVDLYHKPGKIADEGMPPPLPPSQQPCTPTTSPYFLLRHNSNRGDQLVFTAKESHKTGQSFVVAFSLQTKNLCEVSRSNKHTHKFKRITNTPPFMKVVSMQPSTTWCWLVSCSNMRGKRPERFCLRSCESRL